MFDYSNFYQQNFTSENDPGGASSSEQAVHINFYLRDVDVITNPDIRYPIENVQESRFFTKKGKFNDFLSPLHSKVDKNTGENTCRFKLSPYAKCFEPRNHIYQSGESISYRESMLNPLCKPFLFTIYAKSIS